jgi:hypothetical protein
MQSSVLKILFIGDIIGRSGRKAVSAGIKEISEKENYDCIIANVENSASGFGITLNVYKELKKLGIDIMTSGNHIWDKKESEELIGKFDDLLRPANYPEGVPGSGSKTVYLDGCKICVSNIMGRVFMPLSDCPFKTFDNIYEKESDAFHFVDFHGEATSEKNAFGLYTDSRAAAVCGTHTHVQTNDDRILPGGTFYISDAGMCGSADSVIGTSYDKVMRRFLYSMPSKFEVEKKGRLVFNAVSIFVNKDKLSVEDFRKIKIYFGE